jgi:hypothetical protein
LLLKISSVVQETYGMTDFYNYICEQTFESSFKDILLFTHNNGDAGFKPNSDNKEMT